MMRSLKFSAKRNKQDLNSRVSSASALFCSPPLLRLTFQQCDYSIQLNIVVAELVRAVQGSGAGGATSCGWELGAGAEAPALQAVLHRCPSSWEASALEAVQDWAGESGRNDWKCSSPPIHTLAVAIMLSDEAQDILLDRLNTRGVLHRRNMHLDDYNCEMCILQREETIYHLFLKCNFARQSWESIGLHAPLTSNPGRAVKRLKQQLPVPFYMEIIILMAWSIWTTRNDWIFNGKDPTIQACKDKFKREFALVIHRAKARYLPQIKEWLQALE
ncbi:hypothetical protein EJB05_40731, partial [Eragrostis curvula]